MNKKIITIAIIALLATTAPVFAQQTPTQANAAAGSGNPPTVMAKYEFIKDNPNMDDDSTKPWLQVNPPAGFNQTKTLYYVLISTDSNLQLADLGNSYVDVYHPDGTRKYEVALDTKVSCNDNSGNLEAMITQITAADSKHLITYAPGQTLTTVIAALRQCKAKIYWGQADMNSCQMCGQFTWRHDCVDCGNQWSVDDFCTGYKVDGYTYDASNKNPSPILTNYFEYICSAGLEADFNKLDFGTVTPGGDQWIGGDTIWNSLGVGCNQPGCVPPTIRNTGNIPINISITQDDMGFGQLNTGTWNVYWDARLGEFNEHAVSTFDPYQTTVLDGTVGLCGYSKISFSMHVKKIDPTLFGTHTGHVTLEPDQVNFPWFTEVKCNAPIE